MTTYLFTHLAPAHHTSGPDSLHAWARWYQQLGAHIKDRDNPVFAAQVIGTEAGATTVLGGYSLLPATSLDDAAHRACGCPILTAGRSVEVGDLANIDDGYDQWLRDHPAPSV